MRRRRMVYLRRFSQIAFLGFFVYVLWSTTYPLQGKFPPEILFKIDPLLMFLTAVSQRLLLPGLIWASVMLVLTAAFGRFFCGWMCPLGTLIDAWGCLKNKKRYLTDDQNQSARRGKYYLLGALVILALAGVQAAWVFDPIVTAARVVSLNLIPAVTWAVDKVFIFFIQTFQLYGGVYDFYRELKSSFLGVDVHFFANSLVTLVIFFLILYASWFLSRFWCRVLCPLGALFAVTARRPLLRRTNDVCTKCGRCQRECRMGAIKTDASHVPSECILCMDCVYDCVVGQTRFSFGAAQRENKKTGSGPGMSRRSFLYLLGAGIFSLGAGRVPGGRPRIWRPIRPPGVQNEEKFLNTCVRCGNCMKVCPTNGLQPSLWEGGWQGVWAPQLVPEIGWCEYNCTLCGQVCPTAAIPKLPVAQKKQTKLGLAEIDHSLCLAWAEHKECIVCEEHCPVAEKAIKTEVKVVNGQRIYLPQVDPNLCIGCGICQNKCPVAPVRAIRVSSV